MNCEFGMIENVKIFIIEIPQISSYIVYIWLSIAACNQDILVFENTLMLMYLTWALTSSSFELNGSKEIQKRKNRSTH